MTAEDELRTLLGRHAESTVPAGDGLTVIQRRIDRRRRVRLLAVPSTAAVAVGVVAALVLTGGGGTDKLVVVPAHTAEPTSSATADVAPATPYEGQALLEFSSDDKDEVVRRWLSQVGVQGTPEKHTCESCDVVGIAVGGAHVGEALLSRSFAGGAITYHLVGVDGAGMAVTSPEPGGALTPPAAVTGTLDQGVDESVLLRLLTTTGRQVAQTSAPAGSAVPWSGSLTWEDTTWATGEIVATTSSAKDGSITRLAAVPVNRSDHLEPAGTPPAVRVACGRTSLEVRLAPDPGGHYTGDSSVVLLFRNAGTHACSLQGYAQLAFEAADGTALPFGLRHGSGQAFADPGALPVTLAPGAEGAIGVTKYRCDLPGAVETATVRLTFPGLPPATLRGLAGTRGSVAFCGVGDPGSQLIETALVGSVSALIR